MNLNKVITQNKGHKRAYPKESKSAKCKMSLNALTVKLFLIE
jgi:hypothetical protein